MHRNQALGVRFRALLATFCCFASRRASTNGCRHDLSSGGLVAPGNYQLPITNYELRITNYQLPIAGVMEGGASLTVEVVCCPGSTPLARAFVSCRILQRFPDVRFIENDFR